LSMGNDGVRFENLKQTDIFCPEAVAWRLTKQTQDSQYSRNIPWSVRVARMAGDAYETIFGNRTGRPDPSVLFSKPAMGGFMMDVHRISQGKKQIDVQKIGRQGVSSRRRLTSSGVTKPALGWTGNSGRPSFVVTGDCRVMDCRARSESTRPIVVPRCLASSLAAKRTSSSRSIVVRIVSSQDNTIRRMHLMFDDNASQAACQVEKRGRQPRSEIPTTICKCFSAKKCFGKALVAEVNADHYKYRIAAQLDALKRE
jgi:hypothetical protein